MMLVLLILLCQPLIVLSDSLPYAEWAHYHMVWLSNEHTNQNDIQAMFDGYANHQIPFGTVNIDSRWATNFNTFIFNSTAFPSIRTMLDGFRANNTHIVLWMTSFINIDSPNYEYAQARGYLYNTTLTWWHGQGRLLDYFNVNAVNWWHSQIERLLDAVGPIHAFKADASDPYIEQVEDVEVTWEQYRTAYYNDTFQLLRRLIGPDALIMSRPVDNDLEFTPTNIVFMGWVGDEDGTYDGLKTALRYMLESGRDGYVGFGSDIGGYRSDPNAGPLGRTKNLFLRWAAIGALSSFMENGGTGEHLPWNFDDETVNIYRSWVNLHYKLVPYLYTEGTKVALGHNGTLMSQCRDFAAGKSQSYFLGPNFFVVPVLEDPAAGQTQDVWFPKSPTKQWIDYFDTTVVHHSSRIYKVDTSRLDRIPLYVPQNSLIPMYDIEQSGSLNAYRFVLWGEVIVEQQTSTLFTRDGQHWLIEFNSSQRKVTVHFVEQYDSVKKEEWTWKFCQYVNGQELCSQDWMALYDNASIQLDFLI